jgi:hypothetical protein
VPLAVATSSPAPHAGLIFLLSKYTGRDKSRFATHAEIDVVADDAWREILKSNWGPLAVACDHHRQELKHCWIVCTAGGSAPQFEAAKRIVKKFAGPEVECHAEEIEAVYEVKAIAEKIARIYDEAALKYNLLPNRIIADFTGGTATMSAGVILATMTEDRKIEYLRQDQSLLKDEQTAKTGQEILDDGLLISIETRPAFLPDKQRFAK